MPDDAVEKMVDATVRQEFNSHAIIVREGAQDDDLFIVFQGGASLTTTVRSS